MDPKVHLTDPAACPQRNIHISTTSQTSLWWLALKPDVQRHCLGDSTTNQKTHFPLCCGAGGGGVTSTPFRLVDNQVERKGCKNKGGGHTSAVGAHGLPVEGVVPGLGGVVELRLGAAVVPRDPDDLQGCQTSLKARQAARHRAYKDTSRLRLSRISLTALEVSYCDTRCRCSRGD